MVLALWRFVVGIADPSLFLNRPQAHLLFAGVWVGIFAIAVAVHFGVGLILRRTYGLQARRKWRGVALLFVTVALLLFHYSAIPLRMMFWLHQGAFEAARDFEVNAMTREPRTDSPVVRRRSSIGLFRIEFVLIGADGQVVFWHGDWSKGGGVQFAPSGDYLDPMVKPHRDHGQLAENWFWFTTQ